jgi:hypothetical protein
MRSRTSLLLLAPLLATAAADAQRFGEGRGRGFADAQGFFVPAAFAGNTRYDGRFTFARIKYRGGGRGAGWAHDYPRAESHFMNIIKSITAIHPFVADGPIVGGNVVALDDKELFKYPVSYLSEPGGWFPNPQEIEGMRNYLLKGGFVIVDDFDGGSMNRDWMHFVDVMRQILPRHRVMEVPQSHPIFDSFFKIDLAALVSYGTGDKPGYFGVFEDNDPRKRIMMIVNFGFNVAPTNEAYKLGVNYLIYALTH